LREQVKEIVERVRNWPDDDLGTLAKFVHEVEEWRAGDEVVEEREVTKVG
jgi:hypothetical protein